MSDLRVPFASISDAFGTPAVITRPAPDDEPIEATVVWLPDVSVDVPDATDFQRREPRRVIALPRDSVPTVPRGTLIVAPAQEGGVDQTWLVDGTERVEVDHTRVLVLLTDDET